MFEIHERKVKDRLMGQPTLIPNEEHVETLEFFIKGRVEGQRLDAYLVKRFEDYSRTYLQKLIKGGKVFVNGKPAKASHKIRVGQEVRVELPQLEELHLKPEQMPLTIVYEDEDIVAINKQANLIIHPARGHLQGTLVNGLIFYFENLSDYNDAYRPGIVHRLDRDTSGILLVAKNNIAHAGLAAQFENREIHKEYLALVEGNMKLDRNIVNLPLAVDPRNRERMSVRKDGKISITEYQVLMRYPGYTLVHVFPKTGRTHQIRVHLKSEGHVIIADDLYGANPILTKGMVYNNAKMPIPPEIDGEQILMERTALHAWQIHFHHPTKKEDMTLVAQLPSDFANTLRFLQARWPNPKVEKICNC